ncbi:MAG: M48 family metallopeptidase [Chitinivibrionales bacterium]
MNNTKKKNPFAFLLPLAISLGLVCQPVPITGRKQLTLIPSGQINQLAFDQYEQMLKQKDVIRGTKQAQMVKRVGQRIKNAVQMYMSEHNMSDQLEGYEWEFTLFEDSTPNAWAMPGGKVGVHTGILPITQTEAGLAVVMGHEIAHVIAQHGNERMSQQLLVQLGGIALSEALSQKPEATRQIFMAAYGLGSQIGVLLPYSRMHESEADRLGLIFMAMAGYNPNEAVDFWQRMQQQAGGKTPPEFLSTHPSHKGRIDRLQELIPGAMEYYRESQG